MYPHDAHHGVARHGQGPRYVVLLALGSIDGFEKQTSTDRFSVDCWSGVAAKEDYLCSGPRFFTGNSREISILFSGDRSSSSLHVTVQVYRSTDTQEETGNPRTVDFPRDRVPSHSMLERWVERQMERESGPEFGLMLQNFLRVYSKEGVRRLPKVSDILMLCPGLSQFRMLCSSISVCCTLFCCSLFAGLCCC